MKKILTIVASMIAVLGLALMPVLPARAANCDSVSGTSLAACSACIAEEGATWEDGKCVRKSGGDITSIIHTVINAMLFIVGILAVIMIVFAGIRYVTSAGDKGKVDAAKNTIIYSVVGLIVSVIAFALVQWVFDILSKN
ncbi:pilin [Candidatus Saccharibacteria bacterium]|nr:pilin [Candidatus Saccharibacteria bacterium]